MFKYFICLGVSLKAKEVDPDCLGDNVFNILNYRNKVFPIAREFNQVMRRHPEARRKYSRIVDRYISFCDCPLLFTINTNRVFSVIRENKIGEFRQLNPI